MNSFTGSYSINMDAKGRIAIPTKVREILAAVCSGRITLTAHAKERCLLIYPEAAWQKLVADLEALPNVTGAPSRLQRIMMGYASEMELDGSGRILLSPTMRDYAQMEKKLMLFGAGKKFELWGEEKWNEYLDQDTSSEELTAAMEGLSL